MAAGRRSHSTTTTWVRLGCWAVSIPVHSFHFHYLYLNREGHWEQGLFYSDALITTQIKYTYKNHKTYKTIKPNYKKTPTFITLFSHSISFSFFVSAGVSSGICADLTGSSTPNWKNNTETLSHYRTAVCSKQNIIVCSSINISFTGTGGLSEHQTQTNTRGWCVHILLAL